MSGNNYNRERETIFLVTLIFFNSKRIRHFHSLGYCIASISHIDRTDALER